MQEEIVAQLSTADNQTFNINVPITGDTSTAIPQLKAQLVQHVATLMKAQEMDADEDIDLMEEVIEDEAGNYNNNSGQQGSGKKKKRRKQQEAAGDDA